MDAHQAGASDAKIPSAMSLHREWNSWKRSPEGTHSWMDLSECASQEAFRNRERVLRAFRASRRGERRGQLVRLPSFKKKSRHDGFRLTGSVRLQAQTVTLPRVGPVRLCEDAARWVEREGARGQHQFGHREPQGGPMVLLTGSRSGAAHPGEERPRRRDRGRPRVAGPGHPLRWHGGGWAQGA